MRSFKWTFPAAALVVALCSPVIAQDAASEPAVRIGYVNMQKALVSSKAGEKAKVDFQAEVEKLEKRLEGKKTELEKMKEDLERRAVVMKEEERRKLADEFERKRLDLKLQFEEAQLELQKKDQELTGAIVRRLQEVISQVGDEKGYTLILELGTAVLYFKSSDNITDEVLKAFDATS